MATRARWSSGLPARSLEARACVRLCALALICTAGGLGVAILAVFAFNFFQNWLSRFELDFEIVSSELLHALAPEGAIR